MAEVGMEDTMLSGDNDKIEREAPELVTVLKDIKGGLDDLRAKVQLLTSKVKSGVYPTSDGMSYLEVKHLLLLNYCQSLVYYLLRKAKGLPIQGHPLIHSLLETRLFLEKIRPIDKKLQYQIRKLVRLTGTPMEEVGPPDKKKPVAPRANDDSLKLRPNPDMLIDKVAPDEGNGLYRPPNIAPVSMSDDEKGPTKAEKNALRKEKQALREALQSEYTRDLMNDLEGRPEEVREVVGTEDRDVMKYRAKFEERARREEELFTRAPLTSIEKKKLKHMRKSRSGLLGLSDDFYGDIKTLPIEEEGEGVGGQMTSFNDSDVGRRKFKKHKRRH